MFLHDTYDFDVEAATNGVLEYKLLDGRIRKLTSNEKLDFEDVSVLATQVSRSDQLKCDIDHHWLYPRYWKKRIPFKQMLSSSQRY